MNRFLLILGALLLFFATAHAQIAYDTASFNRALAAPAGASSFGYRKARVRTENLAGLLYKVHYQGPEEDYTLAGEVIGAAIGDPGIVEPFVNWMQQNAAQIAAQKEPVVVGLANAFTLTFLPGQGLSFVVAPVEVEPEAFGEPRHVLGSGEITIREYSDFECPACQALFTRALAQIKSRYVESGRARFEYRHFPLYEIHAQAVAAAEASECAADQDKFWAYHDALFTQGVGNYTALAETVGLDVDRFARCVADRTHKNLVEAHRAEADRLGLRGTPSVFVGPFLLPNPFDVDSYERYLRMAAAKSAR
ncbi:MAG TPA: thioredoxin [Oceanithermus profundus]|uniref:Thioredoxin n=1 Tax=Oceanithermus profundus TaxID=187137 RepID=A0A7C4ZHP0_9DEIN|nr:thioredoxin [Oceanithermus profundus]